MPLGDFKILPYIFYRTAMIFFLNANFAFKFVAIKIVP